KETPGQVELLVKQTAALDGVEVPVRIEEEPGSSGVALTHHYATSVLVGHDFKGIKTMKDKATRAAPLSSAAEYGNVKLVRGPWNNAFLDEAVLFPGGEHDDQIDAVSGAVNALTSSDAGRFAAVHVGKMRY
ncbi:MAG: phage terminase large subunit, partial [Longimicrobiales bacterium]|nr:phage terminase large subunit [Longimicrobiales bacterium]